MKRTIYIFILSCLIGNINAQTQDSVYFLEPLNPLPESYEYEGVTTRMLFTNDTLCFIVEIALDNKSDTVLITLDGTWENINDTIHFIGFEDGYEEIGYFSYQKDIILSKVLNKFTPDEELYQLYLRNHSVGVEVTKMKFILVKNKITTTNKK